MRWMVLVMIVVGVVGCRQEATPKDNEPKETKVAGGETTDEDAAAELRGIARNAKAGAVVIEDAGRVIYVEGKRAWNEDILGSRVVVTGRLERTKHIPDPDVEDGGAISQGAFGEQWVVYEASWKPE